MRFRIDSNANQMHTKESNESRYRMFQRRNNKDNRKKKKIGQVQVPADFV